MRRKRPQPPKIAITVELEEDVLELLAVLRLPFDDKDRGREENARGALLHLIHSAADGVRRPGAWERSWLNQAFGYEFEDRLELDPECDFYRRPRRPPAAAPIPPTPLPPGSGAAGGSGGDDGGGA